MEENTPQIKQIPCEYFINFKFQIVGHNWESIQISIRRYSIPIVYNLSLIHYPCVKLTFGLLFIKSGDGFMLTQMIFVHLHFYQRHRWETGQFTDVICCS